MNKSDLDADHVALERMAAANKMDRPLRDERSFRLHQEGILDFYAQLLGWRSDECLDLRPVSLRSEAARDQASTLEGELRELLSIGPSEPDPEPSSSLRALRTCLKRLDLPHRVAVGRWLVMLLSVDEPDPVLVKRNVWDVSAVNAAWLIQ